ncbi:MAG TPA: aldehyde dehydrogenase family protein [Thermoplasmata archaeon]|nr:aldehyde dehydrogenase family protein [Thermoplasmata archaeon]
MADSRDETGLLFIDGEWRPPSGDRWTDVRDPSTGAVFARVAQAGPVDADAAMDAAAARADSWGETPAHERARLLRGIAERIENDHTALARLIAREVGKPIQDSRIEVTRAVGVYRYAAEEVRQLTGETFPADAYPYPPGNERRLLFTVRDPIGVVVAISPFNFPLNLLSHKVAPALAAGNPVVVKPASSAALTALRLARIAEAAGIPKGVLQVVPGPGGSVGNRLVEHPATRLITFTGSTEVGKSIGERAGRHAKRVILEMGGLDPVVVLDDAPVDVAVAAALRGGFAYSGQVCTASKRVLVAESIADDFARKFAAGASRLVVGPAVEESTQVGPVVTPESLDRMDQLVADAGDHSATVLAGGERAGELAPGWFYRPTVLDHVPPEATVAREEPFGPVVPILRFQDLEEALTIANGTSYGLQAAVYTRDLRRAFEFVRRIRAGGVHVNDPTTLRWDALPFGGVRESGLGREGLRYAMQEMTEVKLVSVNFG